MRARPRLTPLRSLFACGLLFAGAFAAFVLNDASEAEQTLASATSSAQHERAPRLSGPPPPASPPAPPPPRSNELDGAWGRFQTGDYEGAITLLRKGLIANPTDARMRENLATALFALALVRVKGQQLADAEKLLDESARLGNAEAARALASLKLKLGNVDLAQGLFEELFDATSDPQSLRVLVDVALRGDDLDRAEFFLGKLPEGDSFAAARRRRLGRKRAFSRTQESVERGGVVEVAAAEGLPAGLAGAVAQAMEEALGELAVLLGPVPVTSRMKAFLFPQENYRSFTDAPPWAGGLFDGLISIPVSKMQVRGASQQALFAGLARVARHETTHAYLYAFCGDTLPSWLGEGLAQKLEGRGVSDALFDLKKSGSAAFEARPLLDSAFAVAPAGEVLRLYAQSFLLVDNLSQRGQNGAGWLAAWRPILSRACQAREPLASVLAAEFGESKAVDLWKRAQASIMTK